MSEKSPEIAVPTPVVVENVPEPIETVTPVEPAKPADDDADTEES